MTARARRARAASRGLVAFLESRVAMGRGIGRGAGAALRDWAIQARTARSEWRALERSNLVALGAIRDAPEVGAADARGEKPQSKKWGVSAKRGCQGRRAKARPGGKPERLGNARAGSGEAERAKRGVSVVRSCGDLCF